MKKKKKPKPKLHHEARPLQAGEAPPPALGDCYEAAFNFVQKNHDKMPGLHLVHGVCLVGTGPNEGLPFGHAWCEAPMPIELPTSATAEFRALTAALTAADALVVCIDKSNARDIQMPKALYYFGGRITQVHRYTWREAAKWAVKTRHFGHWELDVDN